jgi:hypothetical protein
MSGIGSSVGSANDISALATTLVLIQQLLQKNLFMGTSGKVFRLDDPINAAASPVDITTANPFGTRLCSSISVNPDDDTLMVTFKL